MPSVIEDRLNVRVAGNGERPMMFAHGFGCDQNMWRFVAPAFEQDFRTILFDYVSYREISSAVSTALRVKDSAVARSSEAERCGYGDLR